MVKRQPAMRETQVQSLGWADLLEKEMPTHSSTLAWKIWTEEPGRLQSMESQSHTGLSNFTSCITESFCCTVGRRTILQINYTTINKF